MAAAGAGWETAAAGWDAPPADLKPSEGRCHSSDWRERFSLEAISDRVRVRAAGELGT